MAKWLAKEFDWDTGRYTGRYYDIAEAGIVAVFVDSFYGDNTAAGTAAAPFKTLGKAITTLNSTGANGSRIFMNGIFSETLPTQTYWYEFIGCGGGRNGRALFNYNQTSAVGILIGTKGHRFHNVQMANYPITPIIVGSWGYFVNCLFDRFQRLGGVGTYYDIYFYFCYVLNVDFTRCTALGNNNIMIDNIMSNTGYTVAYNFQFSLINNCSYSQLVNNVGNLINTVGQFINPTLPDYNFSVRITSPLLGAAAVDQLTGVAGNIADVSLGIPYNGINPEFTTEGGATITDLTIDANGKFTITPPATVGTLETALMDLGNIYPLEGIDVFNIFDFLAGEITQGVFEDFVSPRMALTIKLKYGLTSAEVDDCPWLLIEYGKQPTFSGTGASRVGNAADTFDPDTFQTITCRYMKLFVTLQNNS